MSTDVFHVMDRVAIAQQRRPPRSDRAKPDDRVRCRLCDWELRDGEGITRTRPCCAAGLQFDLDKGLTLTGSAGAPQK